jgi:hypothetical protein
MVKSCSLPRHQPIWLKPGDCVRYIGLDPRIQQDYGDQDLRIIAIDFMNGIAVCDNQMGQRLVGVALRELQK